MMNNSANTKLHNRLWQARKRSGLGQKQVAALLHHHTADQVSRYEKGLRAPNLETALRLEIIFRTPIRQLFGELYKLLLEEVEGKTKDVPGLQGLYAELTDCGGFGEFCTHAETLLTPDISKVQEDAVRRHVTILARHLAELAPKNAED